MLRSGCLCGISGQPRLGLVAFSSLREHGGQIASNPAAFPHRWPKQSGQLLVVFGLVARCPAASGSTTGSLACATTTPWGSGTPGRFPRCDEPCESSTAWRCRFLIARRAHPAHSSICAQVTEGTRDHSSNHNSDFAVCLYCFLDAVTCGALKPNDMWYYSIKYDDGEEEHKVGPARIFPNK